MSDDNADEKAWDAWLNGFPFGNWHATPRQCFMAGRASRDAEMAAIKEVDDSEIRYRDDVEIPALKAQLAEAQAIIEKAPHDEDCSINDWHEWWEGVAPNPVCNCWKSALSAPSSTGGN